MSATIIVTRHVPLVDLLRERHPDLLRGEVRVLAHVSDPDEIRGQHVIGVLPLHLASVCASVTEVPLALTPADRGTMAAGDLPLTRLREIAGAPVRYVVRTEEQARDLEDAHWRACL